MGFKPRIFLRPRLSVPSLQEDLLDHIPDALVLTILNKVADVRSLGLCSAVCSRLRTLVPLVHHLHLKIDGLIDFDSDEPPTNPSPPIPQPLFSRLHNLIVSAVTNPFLPHTTHTTNIRRYSPTEVLKNFTNVRQLIIEFPSIKSDGVFLKWRADASRFFVLVGTVMPASTAPEGSKVEIVIRHLTWIVSSFTTEYKRPDFVEPIVRELLTLRSLVLMYGDGQGKRSYGDEDLRELRQTLPLALSDNAQVPLVLSASPPQVKKNSVELRYVPYLELAGGIGIQGATLLTGNLLTGDSGCSWVAEAFDGPSRATVKEMMMQAAYLRVEI